MNVTLRRICESHQQDQVEARGLVEISLLLVLRCRASEALPNAPQMLLRHLHRPPLRPLYYALLRHLYRPHYSHA